MKSIDHTQLIAAQTYGSMRPAADPRLAARAFPLPQSDGQTVSDRDRNGRGQSTTEAARPEAAPAKDAFTPRAELRAQLSAMPDVKPAATERPPRPGAYLDIRV
jgi:hypothetical protein